MGWEQRRGTRYYYRKRRVNGKVVSEYIGRGAAAEAAALADAMERMRAHMQRNEQHEQRAELDAVEKKLRDFRATVRTTTRAMLLANGYHQHKGQWRKSRDRAATD